MYFNNKTLSVSLLYYSLVQSHLLYSRLFSLQLGLLKIKDFYEVEFAIFFIHSRITDYHRFSMIPFNLCPVPYSQSQYKRFQQRQVVFMHFFFNNVF